VTKGEKSLQTAGTPDELYRPVDNFWRFVRDIAASRGNNKCPHFWTEEHNALTKPWHQYLTLGCPGWLNHPYADCTTWVKKAHEEALLGATVVMLQPAAVHRVYYREFVKGGPCGVILLNRPVQFIGYKLASPTPHALFVWNKGLAGKIYGEADYLDRWELTEVFNKVRASCV
jgi:phage N-6-adenine-methyltransferase